MFLILQLIDKAEKGALRAITELTVEGNNSLILLQNIDNPKKTTLIIPTDYAQAWADRFGEKINKWCHITDVQVDGQYDFSNSVCVLCLGAGQMWRPTKAIGFDVLPDNSNKNNKPKHRDFKPK